MHVKRRAERDERGAVAILVSLSLVVLGMSCAMAVDIGNLAQLHRHAQFTVDDAAISGADLLEHGTDSLTQIVSATESYIDENWNNVSSSGWGTCPSAPSGFSAPVGSTENCVTFNGTSTATASAINVEFPPQSVPFTLARLGGFVSGTVEASATAVTVPGTSPCALCVLGTSGTTLQDTGNATFTVTDTGSSKAGIIVNSPGTPSTNTPAAQITGKSGSITAPQIDLVGNYAGVGYHPTPITGATAVLDPLGDLVAPTPASNTIPSACGTINNGDVLLGSTCGSISIGGNSDVTISPGNYNSISVGGSATLTLTPGTYFITGSFSVFGSTTTDVAPPTVDESAGVLLYFTCSSNSGTQIAACPSGGQLGEGSLSMTGKASLNLVPQTTGPYAGLTVFYDRNDNAPLSLVGTSSLSLSGTLYAKSSALSLNGNGSTLSSLIIVNSATISGNDAIGVNYDSSDNATVSGTPYLCSTTANNC